MPTQRFSLVQTLSTPQPTTDSTPLADDALTAAFNETGHMMCYGGLGGKVNVVQSAQQPFKPSNFALSSAMVDGKALTSAVSCLMFRPNGASTSRNVLLVGCTDGSVSHWHLGSQKMIRSFFEYAFDASSLDVSAERNQVLACGYAADGLRYATAGKDGALRLYDERQPCQQDHQTIPRSGVRLFLRFITRLANPARVFWQEPRTWPGNSGSAKRRRI